MTKEELWDAIKDHRANEDKLRTEIAKVVNDPSLRSKYRNELTPAEQGIFDYCLQKLIKEAPAGNARAEGRKTDQNTMMTDEEMWNALWADMGSCDFDSELDEAMQILRDLMSNAEQNICLFRYIQLLYEHKLKTDAN